MADVGLLFARGHASRLIGALIAGLLVALGSASVAHADPAGPTDYRSVVVAVEPVTPTIEASIVGGDSFVRLRVDRGTDVIVLGYQDEDYLWFRSDGVVLENENSPSTHLNADRYGGSELPATASADAEPDWRQVASGGDWAWHDHRAHWMQTSRPVGYEPGDVIVDAVIQVRVDGESVDVRVTSTWLPEPSPIAAWVGVVAGLAFGVAAWGARRMGMPALFAALPVSAAALMIGAWQYWSLPSATGPRLVWVALPAVAVAWTLGGLVGGRYSQFLADAALLIVGVELAVWGFIRRDGLGAAIIPTNAPFWLDRAVTAASMSAGLAFAGLALWWLFGAVPTSAQRDQGADGLAAPGPPVSTS